MLGYTYKVTYSPEDKEFVGLCIEFPSLSSLHKDEVEAFKGIKELVADVVQNMQDCGEVPPAPLATKRYSGKFSTRIPPELHRSLVMQAAEQGISFNRLVSSKLSA